MVVWSCIIKKIKLMRILFFGQMVVHKENINERRPYIFVECLFANERNKSMATLNSGRMVMYK